MKRILLISVLLAFVAAARPANAITVENITVSDTGGEVSVSGEAHASGSSDADAGVRSFIRTEGSNTRVRIDISAASDGESEATSSELIMTGLRNPSSAEAGNVGAGRFEVRNHASKESEKIEAEAGAAASSSVSSPGLVSAWASFKASFAKLYQILFFRE